MQFIIPTIFEDVTTSARTAPAALRQQVLPLAELTYLQGPWGSLLSQSVTRKEYTLWLHDWQVKERGMAFQWFKKNDVYALHLVLGLPLRGSFTIEANQCALVHLRGGIRNQWLLQQGHTQVIQLDAGPAFLPSLLLFEAKPVYLSRRMQLLVQRLANIAPGQVAPDMFMDGIVAELLQEYVLQCKEQADAVVTGGALFHFSQKDLGNIRKAKAFIDASVSKRPSLKELALIAGTNTDMLKKGFKHVYGQTVHRYWLQLSLAYAKELVLTTREPIKSVAAACGFDNYPHFVQQFKKHWGTTPRKLRDTT